jgi:hypothetical protein
VSACINNQVRALQAIHPMLVLLVYRDGVSEGQFYQVLWHELNALWKVSGVSACLIFASGQRL